MDYRSLQENLEVHRCVDKWTRRSSWLIVHLLWRSVAVLVLLLAGAVEHKLDVRAQLLHPLVVTRLVLRFPPLGCVHPARLLLLVVLILVDAVVSIPPIRFGVGPTPLGDGGPHEQDQCALSRERNF